MRWNMEEFDPLIPIDSVSPSSAGIPHHRHVQRHGPSQGGGILPVPKTTMLLEIMASGVSSPVWSSGLNMVSRGFWGPMSHLPPP